MIPATFLTILSLPGIILADSYQEIVYQPNSPFYNLIFSEKFPPQLGKFVFSSDYDWNTYFFQACQYSDYRWFDSLSKKIYVSFMNVLIRYFDIDYYVTETTRPKKKDQARFVPAKVQISKPDLTFTFDEKKQKQTWFHQLKRTFSNLKLAFHDCKLTPKRYKKKSSLFTFQWLM